MPLKNQKYSAISHQLINAKFPTKPCKSVDQLWIRDVRITNLWLKPCLSCSSVDTLSDQHLPSVFNIDSVTYVSRQPTIRTSERVSDAFDTEFLLMSCDLVLNLEWP